MNPRTSVTTRKEAPLILMNRGKRAFTASEDIMLAMGVLLDLAEQLWNGEVSTLDRHPFAPLMVLEEIAPSTAFLSSFANVTALKSEDSLLLVDTGGWHLAPMVFGSVRAWSEK